MLGWKPVHDNTLVCWGPNDDEKYNYQISMVKLIQKAFRRWQYEEDEYYQINKVIRIQKAWRQYAERQWEVSFREQRNRCVTLTPVEVKRWHPWRGTPDPKSPPSSEKVKRWHPWRGTPDSKSPPSSEKEKRQTVSDFYPKKTVSDLYTMMLSNRRLSDEQRTKIIKMLERRQHRMSIPS
jgi:hypothetical protein